MSYTAPTETDIVFQGRPDLTGFTASGTVDRGQTCIALGTMQAKAATADVDNFIGVAVYKATDGNMVALAGPGCIVRCIASGSVTTGDDVQTASEGKVYSGGTQSKQIGVALETVSTGATVRVLLI